jgi:predicted PurR-regulated permease PerM
MGLVTIIYIMIFYTFVAVFLQIVISMFLFMMKHFMTHIYHQKKMIIRFYSISITLVLMIRVISLVIDTIVQAGYDQDSSHNKPIDNINDIIMASIYFFELTPSIIIIIVLWKSNNELRMKQIQMGKPHYSLVNKGSNSTYNHVYEEDGTEKEKTMDDQSSSDGLLQEEIEIDNSLTRNASAFSKSKGGSILPTPKSALTYY